MSAGTRLGIFLLLSSAAAITDAAYPAGGVIDGSQRTLRFTGGPYLDGNNTGASGGEHLCIPNSSLCDTFRFTVNLADGPGTLISDVVWSSDVTDFGMPDIDLYLYDDNSGELLGTSSTRDNPEVVSLSLNGTGSRAFRLEIVPRKSFGKAVTGTVRFKPGLPSGDLVSSTSAPSGVRQLLGALILGALGLSVGRFGLIRLRRRPVR
jgi:hypothetical protein